MLRRCKPTGKLKFRDEIAAKITLGHLAAAPLRERREQRAYRCPHGDHWHLTSQARRDA